MYCQVSEKKNNLFLSYLRHDSIYWQGIRRMVNDTILGFSCRKLIFLDRGSNKFKWKKNHMTMIWKKKSYDSDLGMTENEDCNPISNFTIIVGAGTSSTGKSAYPRIWCSLKNAHEGKKRGEEVMINGILPYWYNSSILILIHYSLARIFHYLWLWKIMGNTGIL